MKFPEASVVGVIISGRVGIEKSGWSSVSETISRRGEI